MPSDCAHFGGGVNLVSRGNSVVAASKGIRLMFPCGSYILRNKRAGRSRGHSRVFCGRALTPSRMSQLLRPGILVKTGECDCSNSLSMLKRPANRGTGIVYASISTFSAGSGLVVGKGGLVTLDDLLGQFRGEVGYVFVSMPCGAKGSDFRCGSAFGRSA